MPPPSGGKIRDIRHYLREKRTEKGAKRTKKKLLKSYLSKKKDEKGAKMTKKRAKKIIYYEIILL